MTNNGESIYKIRANFLKMKEHVTQTTRTTDENIIRCFVITFEYNITILLLLKGVVLCYYIQRLLFGIFLTICLHYISIKHIIFSNHSLGWFYYLAVHFCLTFIFIVLLFLNISLNLTATNMHIRDLYTWETFSNEYMSRQ